MLILSVLEDFFVSSMNSQVSFCLYMDLLLLRWLPIVGVTPTPRVVTNCWCLVSHLSDRVTHGASLLLRLWGPEIRRWNQASSQYNADCSHRYDEGTHRWGGANFQITPVILVITANMFEPEHTLPTVDRADSRDSDRPVRPNGK